MGVVGDSIIDPDSSRGDRYCEILDYQEFEEAVPIKLANEYLEAVPESRRANYWRFGVREISKVTYERFVSMTKIKGYQISLPSPHQELESYHPLEGEKKARYSSYYERNPFYRSKAIEIHGLTCLVSGFNFEREYGALGRGFIHVHHNKPVSHTGPTRINPNTDMTVLCPNCHAMIHRQKDKTLSVTELVAMIQASPRRTLVFGATTGLELCPS